ncbi:MAG: hypothetical protein DMF61_15290 [Blastocatellia bacterium AA13]|nr:MAG: hypothetical protein DMF61_15290 [Blastocatellia bacterium AA13]
MGKAEDDASWRKALASVGLALAIPTMIAVPALIGWYMDKRYGTSPVWLIVWLIAGLVSAAFDVYQLMKRFGQFK